MRFPLTVTLGAMLIGLPLHAQAAPDSLLEPSSKVPFPVEITVPGTDMSHTLMGTGIRTKTFLKVKVYAFGLYVDPDGASARLSNYAGIEPWELEKDDSFYNRILQQDFGMTLRLVMTRDVDGDDMADAFDGALRPRVQDAEAEMDMPGGEAALDQFRSFFSLDKVTKGSEIVFSCDANGTLRTLVQGTTQETISSPALCWALFDVYLGEDPISKDGKKSVIRGFPNLLST